MALTNSVIAPLPSAMEVDAAKVAFESFGEVFRVKRLEKFNNFVQVIFYDVRSAADAVKAFGEAGCIPGPQVGERTVKLAGEDQLSTKDFQNISEVLKSKDGAFFLEFYDVRDAMRYQKQSKKEMSIELPPGLPQSLKPQEPCLRSPPGLKPQTSKATWEVLVRHLPSKLLTQVMMEAVFQQAGVELLHFTIKSDKVIAHFDNQVKAQKCVAHFSGCQWDKSGTTVTAEIISPDPKPSKAAGSKGLSAEAPAFNPFVVPHYDFSAEAPAFVPMGRLPKVSEEAATRAPGKLAFGSDTSTEVGDSEEIGQAHASERGAGGARLSIPIPAMALFGTFGKISGCFDETSTRVTDDGGSEWSSSDTSTEVGDSEDDEKNSPARVKYGLSKQLGARARSGSAGS